MLVKKAHVRCQFPKCANAKDAYAFYPSENAGHKPVVLCRGHLNEMVSELKKFDNASKREKREEINNEHEEKSERE